MLGQNIEIGQFQPLQKKQRLTSLIFWISFGLRERLSRLFCQKMNVFFIGILPGPKTASFQEFVYKDGDILKTGVVHSGGAFLEVYKEF